MKKGNEKKKKKQNEIKKIKDERVRKKIRKIRVVIFHGGYRK